MNRWLQPTIGVLAAFPAWSPTVRCLDLAEETGELTHAVLVAEGHKPGGPGTESVATALCGVLFNVLALTAHYRVDLDGVYAEQLAELAARAPGTSGHS